MEEPIAWRAMADRFDDGSLFPGSFVALDMVKHSGISKYELRLQGVALPSSGAHCQLTAIGENV